MHWSNNLVPFPCLSRTHYGGLDRTVDVFIVRIGGIGIGIVDSTWHRQHQMCRTNVIRCASRNRHQMLNRRRMGARRNTARQTKIQFKRYTWNSFRNASEKIIYSQLSAFELNENISTYKEKRKRWVWKLKKTSYGSREPVLSEKNKNNFIVPIRVRTSNSLCSSSFFPFFRHSSCLSAMFSVRLLFEAINVSHSCEKKGKSRKFHSFACGHRKVMLFPWPQSFACLFVCTTDGMNYVLIVLKVRGRMQRAHTFPSATNSMHRWVRFSSPTDNI